MILGWTSITPHNDFTDATLTFNPDSNCLSSDDGDTSYVRWSGSNGANDGATNPTAYVRYDVPAAAATGVQVTLVTRFEQQTGVSRPSPEVHFFDLGSPNPSTSADLPYNTLAAAGFNLLDDGTYYSYTADVTSTSLLAALAAGNLACTLHFFGFAGGVGVPNRTTYVALDIAGTPMLRHKNRDDGLGNSMRRLGPKGPTSQQGSNRRGPRAYT